MREHKYRGKRVDTGEWVYGSLLEGSSGVFVIEKNTNIDDFLPDYNDVGIGCGIEDRNITNRYEAARYGFEEGVSQTHELLPNFIEVIPESVGEFVGLQDKNKKDIYEDDIVKQGLETSKDGWFGPRIVEFSDGAWMGGGIRIFVEQDRWVYQGDVSNNGWEVIGNIYENPELLIK